MARDFKERKRKVSEGHFVVLLPATLVLEAELCVCVCSLYMCRMSVMYLCTSFFNGFISNYPVRWREKHLGQNGFCCLLIHWLTWNLCPQNSNERFTRNTKECYLNFYFLNVSGTRISLGYISVPHITIVMLHS